MKTIDTKGTIVVESRKILFRLCTIVQHRTEDDYTYDFYPDYDVMAMAPKELFDGIPGLNLDLKKSNYHRIGLPVFVAERVFPENRVDGRELLESLGLDYWDPMEIMLRSKNKYSGDDLKVVPYQEKGTVDLTIDPNHDLYPQVKRCVVSLAAGDTPILGGETPDPVSSFSLLFPIYSALLRQKEEAQRKGSEKRKANGSYLGRPKKSYDEKEFQRIVSLYEEKQLSLEDALSLCNVSRSTFFRRVKELKQIQQG